MDLYTRFAAVSFFPKTIFHERPVLFNPLRALSLIGNHSSTNFRVYRDRRPVSRVEHESPTVVTVRDLQSGPVLCPPSDGSEWFPDRSLSYTLDLERKTQRTRDPDIHRKRLFPRIGNLRMVVQKW